MSCEAAAALATASETPSMALAPSRDLFSVPSSARKPNQCGIVGWRPCLTVPTEFRRSPHLRLFERLFRDSASCHHRAIRRPHRHLLMRPRARPRARTAIIKDNINLNCRIAPAVQKFPSDNFPNRRHERAPFCVNDATGLPRFRMSCKRCAGHAHRTRPVQAMRQTSANHT